MKIVLPVSYGFNGDSTSLDSIGNQLQVFYGLVLKLSFRIAVMLLNIRS